MRKFIFILIVGSLLLCCDNNTTKLNEPKPKEEAPEQSEQPEEPAQPEEPCDCWDPYDISYCKCEPYEMPCRYPDEWQDKWPVEEIIYDRELPWDYPIQPGTDEWKELQFGELGGLEAALQIPEEILASLTTEDLMVLIILNPLFFSFSVTVNGTHEGGLDYGFSSFNCIRELFQREDGLDVLLKHYRYMAQNRPFSEGKTFFTIRSLELIISRYQSPDDSNKENYRKIIENLLFGLEEQILFDSEYDWSDDNVNMSDFDNVNIGRYYTNYYSRAIILFKIDEQNLEKFPDGMNNRLFLDGSWIYPSTAGLIDDMTCKYIYNNQ